MKSTKKLLFLSTISLVLCFAMLLGTTWAWFTDSVTSGTNRIQAGNLDVEMYYKHTGTGVAWKNVETESAADPHFFRDASGNDILWEPGVVAYTNFKVENVGNLALKYAFTTTAKTYNTVDSTKSLRDVIKFAVVDGSQSYTTRDEAIAAGTNVGFKDMESFEFVGSLEANATTHPTKEFTVIAYWQPNVLNDDDYNLKNGKKADDNSTQLYIDLEIQLVATQLANESDSFDKYYDAGAAWLGGVDEVPADEDGVITINTPEQLAGFAKSVNEGTSYAGKTIKLGSNLDLNNLEWPGINTGAANKAFTFDGNGKTIKNLKVNVTGHAGLFISAAGCTIKNITVDGASVSGTNSVAVIVGHGDCTKIENCSVKNAAVVANPILKDGGKYDDGDKAAAIVGYLCGEPVAYAKGCTVSDTTIAAFRDLGAIAGIANTDNGDNSVSEVSGNTVGANVKLSYLFAAPYDGHVNENMNDYAGRTDAKAKLENNNGEVTKGEANMLSTPADLRMLATAVNSGYDFAGQTVKLANDIDCGNADMLPIGTLDSGRIDEDGKTITASFNGTFDGNHKTVKNANIKHTSGVGFIGMIGSGELKNITLENVHVTGIDQVGVLVGYTASGGGKVTGCTVNNCSATGIMRNETDDSANNVAALIGYIQPGGGNPITLTGNTFNTVTVKGYRNLGTLVGRMNGNADPAHVVISDNTATNVTILQDLALNNNPKNLAAGEKVGTYVGEYLNCEEQYRTAIENNNNVTVTSKTAKIADGIVYDILTKKLSVNGADASEVEVVTSGLFKDANGNYYVASAKGLDYFKNKSVEGTIKLIADIDMDNATFSSISAPMSKSLTVNGNNHKISNVNVVSGSNDNGTGQASMFHAWRGSTLTISNLTLENITSVADNDGTGYGAAVVGYCEGALTLDNVDVVNASVTGSKSSGILVGHLANNGTLNAKDCDVSGTVTLTDYENGGHYAGKYIGTAAGATTLTNCTANVTLSGNIKSENVGDVYGRVVSPATVTTN